MIDDGDLLTNDSALPADLDKNLLDVAAERVDTFIISAVVLAQRHFGPTIGRDHPDVVMHLASLLASEYDVVAHAAEGDQTSFSEKVDVLRAAAMELAQAAQVNAASQPPAHAVTSPSGPAQPIGVVPVSPTTVGKP